MPEAIRRNSLLARMKAEDRERLALALKPVSLPHGRILAEPRQKRHFVYFPLDCMISLVASFADGQTVETAIIGAEGVDGLGVVFGDGVADFRHVVQLEGQAAMAPAAALVDAVHESDSLRGLLQCYAQTFAFQAMQLVACNAAHNAQERLARWLLSALDRSDSASVSLTHEFLAELLGVSRPTVSLCAKQLEAARLVRIRRGAVEVIDRAGLEDVSCECYEVIRNVYDRLLPQR